MGIRESINLFNSKINQTLWTRQELSPKGKILKTVTNPVVLPVENYYKLLQKRFIKVGENSGSVPKFFTNNVAEYFANTKSEETIAVVSSVKTVDSVPTKISIATYYDENGDIAILNRFDQAGHPHDNYFDVYGARTTEELEFYKKYLADTVFNDPVSGVHYQAYVPHIHFNTASQTVAFGHHDKANAISIQKLISYISDLKNEMNPNALINKIDMGMPFLDLKKAKLDYTSTMLSSVQQIIRYFDSMKHINPEKFSDYEKDTIELMKSLINIDSSGSASVTASPIGGDPVGLGPSFIANSGTTINAISRFSPSDLKNFTNFMPDVNGMSLSQIKELKTHISKIVKVLDSERKRNYQESREVILIDGERYEIQRSIFEYKNYLKYLKGMLNLESISVDLDKYMKIYEVLNERDPLMMSFISKELLKNLTINIKVPTEMEKEGIVNEDTAWQPQ